jgi:hypothetical protein
LNAQLLLGIALIVAGVIIVGALGTLLGRTMYVRQVRRSLVRLIGTREAARAAYRGVEQVLEHLLSADDEALEVFAADPASEDRRALEELSARMRITADELKVLALPKRLWPAAEALELAARELSSQAGAVGEASVPDAVLDRLADIRVQEIKTRLASADEALETMLETFKVNDPSVYGGGLYI